MKANAKRFTIAVAVCVTVAGGTAWSAGAIGSIIGTGGTINGCYQKENGQLRVVAEGSTCRDSELAIKWNEKGPKGDPGKDGSPGDKGPIGDKGPTGDKGQTGDKGEPGEKGITGDQGPAGDEGPAGDKGEVGDKGPIGDKGITGDKGPTGDRGPAGPAGTPMRWVRPAPPLATGAPAGPLFVLQNGVGILLACTPTPPIGSQTVSALRIRAVNGPIPYTVHTRLNGGVPFTNQAFTTQALPAFGSPLWTPEGHVHTFEITFWNVSSATVHNHRVEFRFISTSDECLVSVEEG